MEKQALVLCSGGLDSVTLAHYVKKKLRYSSLKILFFNYGQKALAAERNASRACARALHAGWEEIALPFLSTFSTSSVNRKGMPAAKKSLKNTTKERKVWYVPMRNTLFLGYALALAESEFIHHKRKSDIFIGFKCEGKEPYPDTTSLFLKKMSALAKTAAPSLHLKISAPLIKKDKEDIILLAKKLSVPLEKTISCYTPLTGRHCGSCLACRLRKAGFYWANMPDPTHYMKHT